MVGESVVVVVVVVVGGGRSTGCVEVKASKYSVPEMPAPSPCGPRRDSSIRTVELASPVDVVAATPSIDSDSEPFPVEVFDAAAHVRPIKWGASLTQTHVP